MYRPVASILLAAQYALGDGAPFVFRIVSYALYALASVGVYRLALRLVPASIALFVAVVFAAHPVHVEAVALAVTQNELIVGALAAFMTVLYLDRRRSESGALSARDWAMLGARLRDRGILEGAGTADPGVLDSRGNVSRAESRAGRACATAVARIRGARSRSPR